MKTGQKIKAGALQFVLLIGTVIALMLMTFALLSHTQSLFGKKTEVFIHTIKQADLGLDYMLRKNLQVMDSTSIEIPSDYPIEVKGIKEYWGAFEKYTTVATSKKNRFVKSVLVGKKSTEQLPALYLKNNERPMIIVGDADIKGRTFLPQQGIRPGNIAGNSFYGAIPSEASRLSNSELPSIQSDIRQNLEKMLNEGFNARSENLVRMAPALNLVNSFHNPTQYLYGETLDLSASSLTGNIIVRASRKIIVRASTSLQDVLLIAPEIVIKSKTVGTFQAISSKSIKVEKGCLLNYPSALITIDRFQTQGLSNQVGLPGILIDTRSEVRGLLVYLGDNENQKFSPQIKIEDKATIWGEVYCERNLELEGTVYGSVTTNSFMAIQGGSIYQNHLYNGKIDSSMLPEPYVGLLLGNNFTKDNCKWLY